MAVFAIVLMPLGLVQRYRAGTARRLARPWLATLNIAILALSAFSFMGGAALTNLWVPNAFRYSLAGLAGGGVLGIAGLTLTRWEGAPGSLHYTPNRFLALMITLLVAARLGYGLWRLCHGWSFGAGRPASLVQSGVPGSLAAGALVLGYSLTYWIGVGRQACRYRAPERYSRAAAPSGSARTASRWVTNAGVILRCVLSLYVVCRAKSGNRPGNRSRSCN